MVLKQDFASGKLSLSGKNCTEIFLSRPVGGTCRFVVMNFSNRFKTGTSAPSTGIFSEEGKVKASKD